MARTPGKQNWQVIHGEEEKNIPSRGQIGIETITQEVQACTQVHADDTRGINRKEVPPCRKTGNGRFQVTQQAPNRHDRQSQDRHDQNPGREITDHEEPHR